MPNNIAQEDMHVFLGWIVEAIEFVPMPEGAKHILDSLLEIQQVELLGGPSPFPLGAIVAPSEANPLSALFPDEQGEVIKRKYSLDGHRWLYEVAFTFGTDVFPEDQLLPAGEN